VGELSPIRRRAHLRETDLSRSRKLSVEKGDMNCNEAGTLVLRGLREKKDEAFFCKKKKRFCLGVERRKGRRRVGGCPILTSRANGGFQEGSTLQRPLFSLSRRELEDSQQQQGLFK